jgi:hypothetical protein
VQPFERLRSLVRWGDDDGLDLLGEAADCLAAFDRDPAGLVVACRRLLAHHPANGALWWLCSRVLSAADASDAAWDAWQIVHGDRTAARLADALPFPHDEPIAVIGWPESTGAALAARPDLDVVAVRPRGDDHQLSLRLRRADRLVRAVAEAEVLALSPTHVLVEVAAAGPSHALVSGGASDIAAALRDHGAEVWVVMPAARVLPERLLDAMERAADATGVSLGRIPLDAADRAAGPRGVDRPAVVARRGDCPIAPELLRLGA